MDVFEQILPKIGDVLGRFRITGELGRGGFGVVYRAQQEGLKTDAAIKVMIPQASQQADRMQLYDRFRQEAEVMRQLEHPAAVKVRDFGQTDKGLPYLVTEYVRGKTLDAVIAEGPMNELRVIRIAMQVLGCVAEAHHRNIVHRDLKPANIMVRDIFDETDSVKVLDFGIAKVMASETGVKTQAGLAFGTPYYMAPEQASGSSHVDGRLDLYAFGLIMAECLTGQRVIRLEDTMAALMVHMRPEPLDLDPALTQSPLYEVIRTATQKAPEHRFPNASAMRQAIKQVEHQLHTNTGGVITPAGAEGTATSAPQPAISAANPATLQAAAPSSPGSAQIAPISSVGPTPGPTGGSAHVGAPATGQPVVVHGQTIATDLDDDSPSKTPLIIALAVVIIAGAVLGLMLLPPAEPAHEGSGSVTPGAVDGSAGPVGQLAADDSAGPAGEVAPEGFVLIEAGTFEMGSPEGEPHRNPDEVQHSVTITRDFYLQAHEVTQAEWHGLIGNNPSRFPECGDECPVEWVSWYEAVAYANARSRSEGLTECYQASGESGTLGGGCEDFAFWCTGDFSYTDVEFMGLDCDGYRLPTEAEWEYAARAGSNSALYTGGLEILADFDAPALDPIAWYGGNSDVTYESGFDCAHWEERQNGPASRCGTHAVGEKQPNAWGLYDMLGNVSEWGWDWYGELSPGPVTDPVDAEIARYRTVRGHDWSSWPGNVRSKARYYSDPDSRDSARGFRLARTAAPRVEQGPATPGGIVPIEAGTFEMDSPSGEPGRRPDEVDLGDPNPEGYLDHTIIRGVILQDRDRIRACYEDGLRGDPDMEGRVLMHFVINASGDTSQVEVQESELDNADVEACLDRYIGELVFPAPSPPGIISVSYPFVFHSQ